MDIHKFSITPLGADLDIRLDHYVMDKPIPNRIASLSFGRFAFGSEVWTAPIDGEGYRAGDRWLRVANVEGDRIEGWIPEIHNGERVGAISTIGAERAGLTRLFLDMEFTGLHQKTTLVSIAVVSEDGRSFYAEAVDYDRSQVSPWIQDNIISKLNLRKPEGPYPLTELGFDWNISGTRLQISRFLRTWLEQFGTVEVWGDVLAYDWVLFCELFEAIDTAERLPRNVYYIPFDIATLMRAKGIDPDINRREFSGLELPGHNALNDARMIREIFFKLWER